MSTVPITDLKRGDSFIGDEGHVWVVIGPFHVVEELGTLRGSVAKQFTVAEFPIGATVRTPD